MHVWVLAVCVWAFVAWALGMPRHQAEVLGRALQPRAGRAWRGAGALALGMAGWLACGAWGTGLGLVVWAGHTMLAAGLVYAGLLVLRRRVAAP